MNNPNFYRKHRGNKHNHFRGRGGAGNRMNRQFDYTRNRNDFSDHSQTNFESNFQYQPEIETDTITKRLSEEEIGVTEYMNEHEGFNGIIKARYSDFQVSEINLKGEIAKLTNMEPPVPPMPEDVNEDEDLVLNKYNLEILPMETWDNINKLAVAKHPCTDKVQVDVTGMTKEQRTKIHDAVKRAFPKSVIGSTVTVDDKKFVNFIKYRKGAVSDKRVKWPWPGEYTYFILHKENCDTMEAVAKIADRMRVSVKPAMLGYAGTKDRRAKTSQWLSARRMPPGRVAAACRALPDLHVGDFSFGHVGLRLGMLSGNRFRIALRNVTAADGCVERACALLRRDGFLNYYGLQRFGTRPDTPTCLIGLKLFQGDFREAIDMILKPRRGPLEYVLAAYRSEGAAAAAAAAVAEARRRGRRLREPHELRVIQALAARPNDLVCAIERIPRNVRLLYIHSYQSLIWNKVASRRVQQFGLQPVAGDLVPLDPLDVTEECIDARDDADLEDNEILELTTDEGGQEGEGEGEGAGRRPPAVRALSAAEAASGRYSLRDVVLPLPGRAVTYPPHLLPYYRELLTRDGLPLDLSNKIKQLCVSGAYRALVARPTDVEWRCVRYSDPHADLLRSDLDELRDLPPPDYPPDGEYKALLLSFTLPTSCYATMALRELLKVDTASDNQALQNNYHEVKAKSAAGRLALQTNGEPANERNEAEQSESDPVNDQAGSEPADEESGTEILNGQGASEAANDQSDSERVTDKSGSDVGETTGGVDKRRLEMENEVDAKKAKQDI